MVFVMVLFICVNEGTCIKKIMSIHSQPIRHLWGYDICSCGYNCRWKCGRDAFSMLLPAEKVSIRCITWIAMVLYRLLGTQSVCQSLPQLVFHT